MLMETQGPVPRFPISVGNNIRVMRMKRVVHVRGPTSQAPQFRPGVLWAQQPIADGYGETRLPPA
jgi:hypothetical protein